MFVGRFANFVLLRKGIIISAMFVERKNCYEFGFINVIAANKVHSVSYHYMKSITLYDKLQACVFVTKNIVLPENEKLFASLLPLEQEYSDVSFWTDFAMDFLAEMHIYSLLSLFLTLLSLPPLVLVLTLISLHLR